MKKRVSRSQMKRIVIQDPNKLLDMAIQLDDENKLLMGHLHFIFSWVVKWFPMRRHIPGWSIIHLNMMKLGIHENEPENLVWVEEKAADPEEPAAQP